MAFHILIEKLSETDSEATFRFYDSAFPNEDGELRLDKQTESISMTKDTREVFFARAARKVGGKKGTDLFMAQYYRSKNNLSPFRKINDTTPIDAQSINTRL